MPSLAPIHVLPTRANDGELLLTPRVVLDYAWASHQRLNTPRGRVSYRQVVSGADRGTAAELLVARCEARGLPDCEAWMETLQYRGRSIVDAFEPGIRFIPAPDGHDCDCTCEGGAGHAQWVEDPPQWRTVRVGALLVRVSRGAEVRVRLASP